MRHLPPNYNPYRYAEKWNGWYIDAQKCPGSPIYFGIHPGSPIYFGIHFIVKSPHERERNAKINKHGYVIATKTISKDETDIGTHPVVVNVLNTVLFGKLLGGDGDSERLWDNIPIVRDLLYEQNQIGWLPMLQGRISVRWSGFQHPKRRGGWLLRHY
jgi:hypothetical protein